MNKNLQYTLMSITGIILMVIASGVFDADSDGEDYAATGDGPYGIESPVNDEVQDPEAYDAVEVVEPEGVSGEFSNEQSVAWVDELAVVDDEYPNDMERLEKYQGLLDDSGNPYAPILLASTIVNVKNQSRDVDIFEEWLDSFGFDKKSVDSLEALAESGNSNAMFLLGVYYYQIQRYDRSKNWLEQAANNEHAGAMNQLAWIYREGLGVSVNLNQAVIWHNYSADAGYPRAMTNLAYLYSIGQGVDKDLYASARWYERAAELKSASAIYAIATYTLNGIAGYEKNEGQGVLLLLEAAQLGHKRAMYVIGKRYENGDGLDRDMEQAMYWYSESAKLGEAEAIDAQNRLS